MLSLTMMKIKHVNRVQQGQRLSKLQSRTQSASPPEFKYATDASQLLHCLFKCAEPHSSEAMLCCSCACWSAKRLLLLANICLHRIGFVGFVGFVVSVHGA